MMQTAEIMPPGENVASIAEVEQAVASGAWERARGLLARVAADPDPTATVLQHTDRLRHVIETALVQEDDWPAAAIRWRNALSEFPDQPALWPFAARCFIQVDEYDDAERVLALISAAYPDNVENWIYAAVNAERQHDWPKAVERWNRVVALKPDDPNMKTLRGHAIWNAEMLATDDLVEDAG